MKNLPFVLAFVLSAVGGAVFGFVVAVPMTHDFTSFTFAMAGGCFGSMIASMGGIKCMLMIAEERQP